MTTSTTNNTTSTNTPAHKISIGSVTATIWAKQAQNGKTYFETSILRCYKNKDGDLKNTSSVSQMELLAVATLAQRAERWIAAQG